MILHLKHLLSLATLYSLIHHVACRRDLPYLFFYGEVVDDRGEPLQKAQVQFWHTDYNGNYDHPQNPYNGYDLVSDFGYFGTATTDSDGYFEFITHRPGIYPSRPITHIHFKVWYRGQLLLTSQFYFDDECFWPDSMLMLHLEDLPDGNTYTEKTIVIDMGYDGWEERTPWQTEGPFYPVVDFFDVGNDLTAGLGEYGTIFPSWYASGTWDPSGTWNPSGTWDPSGTWNPTGTWDPSGTWGPTGTRNPTSIEGLADAEDGNSIIVDGDLSTLAPANGATVGSNSTNDENEEPTIVPTALQNMTNVPVSEETSSVTGITVSDSTINTTFVPQPESPAIVANLTLTPQPDRPTTNITDGAVVLEPAAEPTNSTETTMAPQPPDFSTFTNAPQQTNVTSSVMAKPLNDTSESPITSPTKLPSDPPTKFPTSPPTKFPTNSPNIEEQDEPQKKPPSDDEPPAKVKTTGSARRFIRRVTL
eukprot:CAMPEP_0178818484 /NCGR_PEP_ID=MMETSP0746-20121128/2457_1 /TAXON_ID=913974 /ORGANISM="Nitzschia punctata, Strain CCMP561" /LENGTH=474 /DNA_ID=CAMNT_0020479673 /DNA_START=36 /DNA_END=1460 /DNA_ORIENTATION=-